MRSVGHRLVLPGALLWLTIRIALELTAALLLRGGVPSTGSIQSGL